MPEPVFVPLTLPEHPTSDTVLQCNATKNLAITALERTGLDPDTALHQDTNPNRVLSRYMLPYIENVVDLALELNVRVRAAQENLGVRPDTFGLGSTAAQISQLKLDADIYREMTLVAQDDPDEEQRRYLAGMVYAPMFRGAGFEVPGDDSSPWIDIISVYCRPALYAAAIERADREIKKAQTSARAKPSFGHYVLGAMAIGGLGYMFLKK